MGALVDSGLNPHPSSWATQTTTYPSKLPYVQWGFLQSIFRHSELRKMKGSKQRVPEKIRVEHERNGQQDVVAFGVPHDPRAQSTALSWALLCAGAGPHLSQTALDTLLSLPASLLSSSSSPSFQPPTITFSLHYAISNQTMLGIISYFPFICLPDPNRF